ncbi:MAG: tetratricopeptide repeat protein [Gammaproteobacteria bacterium]|nr:tetratricopeptide repeat protein [Gammaproteobacteria bacterium]
MIFNYRITDWFVLLLFSYLLTGCASGPASINSNEVITTSTFVIRDDVDVRPEVRADFDKAIKYLQEEDFERGIRLMNRIVERSDKSIAPYINLGIAYRKTGDMKNAEKNLTKALELNSIHPSANNEMGMVYRKTGRFSEARRIYERILERFPSFLPARKNLGILCDLYINDLECAMANYEIYNKADPGDKRVVLWITDLRKRMESQ